MTDFTKTLLMYNFEVGKNIATITMFIILPTFTDCFC